jgi:hypothetical protein
MFDPRYFAPTDWPVTYYGSWKVDPYTGSEAGLQNLTV